MLTKDQILAVRPKVKEVEVPEWGGSVFIRPLMLGERGRFAQMAKPCAENPGEISRLQATVARWAICDDQGAPLFDDKEIGELMKRSGEPIANLFDAILAFSGMIPGAVDELEKNSPTIPSAESSSI